MKPFTPASVLPDFAAEYASSDDERRELAELFARLGAPPEAEPSAVAQGRARLLAAVQQSDERFAPLFDKLTQQRWYGPGDFHEMSEGSQHSLQMNADQDVLLAVLMAGQIELIRD